jgi:hypothetical protein
MVLTATLHSEAFGPSKPDMGYAAFKQGIEIGIGECGLE